MHMKLSIKASCMSAGGGVGVVNHTLKLIMLPESLCDESGPKWYTWLKLDGDDIRS